MLKESTAQSQCAIIASFRGSKWKELRIRGEHYATFPNKSKYIMVHAVSCQEVGAYSWIAVANLLRSSCVLVLIKKVRATTFSLLPSSSYKHKWRTDITYARRCLFKAAAAPHWNNDYHKLAGITGNVKAHFCNYHFHQFVGWQENSRSKIVLHNQLSKIAVQKWLNQGLSDNQERWRTRDCSCMQQQNVLPQYGILRQ